MMSLDQGLASLHAGEIDFTVFVQLTRPHWRRLSADLHRRWDVPSFVSPEDVEQDMLFAAWQFLERWDPTKADLKSYIVFNASDKAKKRIHKVRGAVLSGQSDRNPSRYEVPETSLAREGEDDSVAAHRWAVENAAPPEQEEIVERRCAAERAKRVCVTVREFLAIEALKEVESVNAAASLLWEDREARRACKLTSLEAAHAVVHKTVRDVASRIKFLR